MKLSVYHIIFLVLIVPYIGMAQWLCPWENRQEIEITENSGATLSNYQVKLEVPYLVGMRTDFGDLRFTTSVNTDLLSYYIETYTSTKAIIWLKIPSLPANAKTTIHLYYCNPTATSVADPKNTFLFFDDFDTFSNWVSIGSGTVSQNTTTFPGTSTLVKDDGCDPSGGYKALGQTINSFRLITREQRRNEGSDCRLNRYGLEGNGFDGYNLRRTAQTNGNGAFGIERRNNGSGSNNQSSNFSQPQNNWYRIELTRCAADNGPLEATLYSDSKSKIGSIIAQDDTYSSFDKVTVRGGRPYYFDFIAVAKYVCDSPSILFKTSVPEIPVAVCQDITVELNNGGNYELDPAELDGGSTDCNTLNFTASTILFDCDDLGDNQVGLTITDTHGNSNDCRANVTVVDNRPPIVNCPADLTIAANNDDCSAIVVWSAPGVRENCQIASSTASHTSGSLFFLGTTTVEYEYIDQSGNKGNCSFTVTVESNAVSPIITLSENSGNTPNDGMICRGDEFCLNAPAGFSSYVWNTGASTQQICPALGGSFFLTTTNATGCTAISNEITINTLDLPEAGTCLVNNDYCQNDEGQVQIQVSNGQPPYSVQWSPAINASSSGTILSSGDLLNINNIPGGTTIDFSITDSNGCRLD